MGKSLKIRQQRDLKEDLVRRDPKGLAGALLHLLSHAGAFWRAVSDSAKMVNSFLSLSHGLLPPVVCWCWVCARLPGPGWLLKAEHRTPCGRDQSPAPPAQRLLFLSSTNTNPALLNCLERAPPARTCPPPFCQRHARYCPRKLECCPWDAPWSRILQPRDPTNTTRQKAWAYPHAVATWTGAKPCHNLSTFPWRCMLTSVHLLLITLPQLGCNFSRLFFQARTISPHVPHL